MPKQQHAIGEQVLVTTLLGVPLCEGVIVETAGEGTRAKVRPNTRISFWRKPKAFWVTQYYIIHKIDGAVP